jgi:hypothetical protein
MLVGAAANNRGRSGFGWFLLAILISPLLAMILVFILSPSEAGKLKGGELKKCEKCAELVKKEAVVCKHCGHEFAEA